MSGSGRNTLVFSGALFAAGLTACGGNTAPPSPEASSLIPGVSAEASPTTTGQVRVTGPRFQLIGNNACKLMSVDGTPQVAENNPAPNTGLRTIKITFEASRDAQAAKQEDALDPSGSHQVYEKIETYYIADPKNIVDIPPVDSKFDVTDTAPYWQDRTKPERPILSVFAPADAKDGAQIAVAQSVWEDDGTATRNVMRGCEALAEYDTEIDTWTLQPTTPATVTDPTCKIGPAGKNKLSSAAIVPCNE